MPESPATAPTVFLGCPTRADMRVHALSAGAAANPVGRDRAGLPPVRVSQPVYAGSSLLTFNFNNLWAMALTEYAAGRATHFAMLHDDVCPDPGWLDVLLAEMARLDADVVSCVVPFKDDSGLTSTAVETGDVWNPRRLTLTEAHALPETFGDAEIWDLPGYETTPPFTRGLLLNTGCMLVRLGPWSKKAHFEQADSIVSLPDGSFAARTASEDWNFTRAVRKTANYPVRLFATRKVALFHDHPRYTNARPWGRFRTDPNHEKPVARPAVDAASQDEAA